MGFYEQVEQMQGSLERMARALPGFGGYLRREDRRAADELLRERIARSYANSLSVFSSLSTRIVESGGMSYMEQVQRIDTGLVTFIDRVRTAARGYSGAFDAVKVDEEGLVRLYAFDESLLLYQDQLASGLKALEDAIGGEQLKSVLDELEKLVAEINSVFARRSEAMMALQAQ